MLLAFERSAASERFVSLAIFFEENHQTPAGNGMPQIPGFAILIADARAQALPPGPVLHQIAGQPLRTQMAATPIIAE